MPKFIADDFEAIAAARMDIEIQTYIEKCIRDLLNEPDPLRFNDDGLLRLTDSIVRMKAMWSPGVEVSVPDMVGIWMIGEDGVTLYPADDLAREWLADQIGAWGP